jgi:aryl-alcohol dehydrogenase-like predicted oxidoreductase
VPYSPLGRGFLTGALQPAESLPENDYRRHDPRYSGENFAQNQRILDAVRTVAKRHGATPAQVALAWLLHRGPDVVPIPGTKRRSYLEQNAAASELELSAVDIAELDGLGPAAGPRYKNMSTIDR